jgi:CRISPR-associated protein Cas1
LPGTGTQAADALHGAIKEMTEVGQHLRSAASVEEAMGHEGAAARIYFGAVRLMLKNKEFARREYRPAKDIVNSALNLGYAFLANEATVSVRAMKLDEVP